MTSCFQVAKILSEIQELNIEIAGFELDHGFDTLIMRQKISSNEIKETWPICRWLFIAELRDLIAKQLEPLNLQKLAITSNNGTIIDGKTS